MLICGGILLAACSSVSPIDTDEPGEVEAVSVDGVWVFAHDPAAAGDALHSGTPQIIDGCLVIDNTIVVWPVGALDDATAAVAAAHAGEQSALLIAGDGISTSEGTSADLIPEVITQRCPITAVWFGAP